eukprot:TRINITY_DN33163_c0_g1_i1.p1 TRINITY_DN33163_c0_g1~~TRINITY_DN33163_c0_g1_i1.p1  ORF type:complete len:375 (+),score=97.69 TRINITY_DN33163_c0_g1_i1:94-1218(+)
MPAGVAAVGDAVQLAEGSERLLLPDCEGNPEEFVLEPGQEAVVVAVDDVGDFSLRNAEGIESGWTYAKHFQFADGRGPCANMEPPPEAVALDLLDRGAPPSPGGSSAEGQQQDKGGDAGSDAGLELVVSDVPEASPAARAEQEAEPSWRDEDPEAIAAADAAAAAALEASRLAQRAAQRAAAARSPPAPATPPAAPRSPEPEAARCTALLLKVERRARAGAGLKERVVHVFKGSEELATFVDDSDTRRGWRSLRRSGSGNWVYASAYFEVQYVVSGETAGSVLVWSKEEGQRALFRRNGNRWTWDKYTVQRFGGPVGGPLGDPWWEFRGPGWPGTLIHPARAAEWGRVWGGWVETCHRYAEARARLPFCCCCAQ